MNEIGTESQLAGLSAVLAGSSTRYSAVERRLIDKAGPVDPALVDTCRNLIAAGSDPLGQAFCQIRSTVERRESGAVYTPPAIVKAMVEWAAGENKPARIVDPGAGSGRFLIAAARQFPEASLIAVETDPLAVLMLRANAAVLGFSERLTVKLTDYRRISLPNIKGETLFIGNPPYVRHHDIPERWKCWFAETAAGLGFRASKLAGLHIHFFMKTRQLARPGDFGAFITAAEWLDVNYGSVLRQMLADGLGGASLHVLAPQAMPFADAATTGAITCFRIGRRPDKLMIRTVDSADQLGSLSSGKAVPWSRLEKSTRWSTIIRPAPKAPSDFIELGELFRVHRGQVTGSNQTWIAGNYPGRLPESVLFPTITKAREIIEAGPVLESAACLRQVIDLPSGLDAFSRAEREQIKQFLAWARLQDAHRSYIAQNRSCWWSVRLKDPAPIICTYMARRPPAFARNKAGARLLNIGHGLYPREPLSEASLAALVAWLREHVRIDAGRTYAGGLTKFEPKEVERLLIPRLEQLDGITNHLDTPAAQRRRGRSESSLPQDAP